MPDFNYQLEKYIGLSPFSLYKNEKRKLLSSLLVNLTTKHYNNSISYKNVLDSLNFNVNNINSYFDIPFLPVRVFKEYELLSVPKSEIVKTMTSSGTSGQSVSKIYLDKETSALQTRILIKIVSDFIGKQRIPMLILDSSDVVKNRLMFSARGAGILGFSMFGSSRVYAFNEKMELNIDEIKSFLHLNSEKQILMFGFTFMIWQHFYKELLKTDYKPNLSHGILIHGGGWKKIISESVTPNEFKKSLNEVCDIKTTNIHDYYGMVEQTGTIYMECEYGHLHSSIFSDIIIRRPLDFSVADIGEKGLVQVLSIIPQSYPGHSLLTEDEGAIIGEDDCPCGRLGKYFQIFGRIKNAEIRGCSDTYATSF